MSMAGVLNVLDQFYKSGSTTTPVLESATKHWDDIYVSRYYNWHSGSWKGVYTHGSSYKLKADAPDDAVETLSKNLLVPFLEKLLADGTIHEYEIDTEAIHTEAPGTFWIFYLAANAEGLDKVNAALRETLKANPLGGPAFGSMVDFTAAPRLSGSHQRHVQIVFPHCGPRATRALWRRSRAECEGFSDLSYRKNREYLILPLESNSRLCPAPARRLGCFVAALVVVARVSSGGEEELI